MTDRPDDPREEALRGRYGGLGRRVATDPGQAPRPAWAPSYRGCAGCRGVRRAVAAIATRLTSRLR